MTDLLPCPFCGSANMRYEFAGSQGYICCDDCGTQGPCDEKAADPHCSIDAAKDAWNRRPFPWHEEPLRLGQARDAGQGEEVMDAKGRDLMNRLADALEDFYDREYGWVGDGHGCSVIEEARAYLATPPEPAAPTDQHKPPTDELPGL